MTIMCVNCPTVDHLAKQVAQGSKRVNDLTVKLISTDRAIEEYDTLNDALFSAGIVRQTPSSCDIEVDCGAFVLLVNGDGENWTVESIYLGEGLWKEITSEESEILEEAFKDRIAQAFDERAISAAEDRKVDVFYADLIWKCLRL